MGAIWVSDREAGVRELFGELIAEAEVLDPAELEGRLAIGLRPDALVIDGTQFLALPAALRAELQSISRLLICTALSLASVPAGIVSGPGIAVLAKPFCMDDLEAAVDWLRDAASAGPASDAIRAAIVQRRRPRATRRRTPAR